MKHNVIIIHGAYGHPEENWFGWLKRQLIQLGVECYVPQLPTPEGQSLSAWLDEFNASVVNHITENTILIGHSLGAIFILRWMQLAKIKISHAILAGAFIGKVGIHKFDEINETFMEGEITWELIKNYCKQFICYQSDNDPYVSYEEQNLIANKLNARRIIISNAGHLNEDAGYSKFELLLTHLKQILHAEDQ